MRCNFFLELREIYSKNLSYMNWRTVHFQTMPIHSTSALGLSHKLWFGILVFGVELLIVASELPISRFCRQRETNNVSVLNHEAIHGGDYRLAFGSTHQINRIAAGIFRCRDLCNCLYFSFLSFCSIWSVTSSCKLGCFSYCRCVLRRAGVLKGMPKMPPKFKISRLQKET